MGGPKKYWYLIQYKLKVRSAIRVKLVAFSSAMPYLTFGICHAQFNAFLAEIFEFENK
jgi:hypothetical protein